MKLLLVTVVANLLGFSYSHLETSQQVTLACPATPEGDRGPPGVPGKRGGKGKCI